MKEKRKKGFTLIELLVVVLIIGILAAVALPQYQVAVTKTKYNTSKIYVHSLLDAIKVYHLANNQWPTNLKELDISLPGEIWWGTDIFIPNWNHYNTHCYIWYDGNGNSGAVGCETDRIIAYYVNFQSSNERICRVLTDTKIAKQICFNETQDTAPSRGGRDFYYP